MKLYDPYKDVKEEVVAFTQKDINPSNFESCVVGTFDSNPIPAKFDRKNRVCLPVAKG